MKQSINQSINQQQIDVVSEVGEVKLVTVVM